MHQVMASPPSSDFQHFFATEYARMATSLTSAFRDRTAEETAQERFSQALSGWTEVRRMQHSPEGVQGGAFSVSSTSLTSRRDKPSVGQTATDDRRP